MSNISSSSNPPDVLVPAQTLRLTLAVSATLIVQTGLALIWAGSAAERISQLERRNEERSQLIERTARLEEQVITMRATLDRIEEKLDDTQRALMPR